MNEKTKILLKKEGIDIGFSVLSFFLFVGLYIGLDNYTTHTTAEAYIWVFAIVLLMICLTANIIIQTILNIVFVKNKIKSYVFFYALIIDEIFLCMALSKDVATFLYTLLLSLVLLFVKFLIAKYYHKTLNKINIL